jgi:glycyl-tRNA synthetase beta subunit
MKVERNKVEQWMLSLKERKQTIEGQVSTLQSKLECERIMDKDLIERIRAQIQR